MAVIYDFHICQQLAFLGVLHEEIILIFLKLRNVSFFYVSFTRRLWIDYSILCFPEITVPWQETSHQSNLVFPPFPLSFLSSDFT